jgi:hypothetical protein
LDSNKQVIKSKKLSSYSFLRIQKTVIGEEGSYVNIEIIDVNADGRLDILTSVTGIRGQPGKVICYEVPEQSSFQKGIWRKHILSQAFEPSVNYRALTPGTVKSALSVL